MRDWLSHRAGAAPGATALIDVATDRRRSFEELDRTVDRIAGHLSALGVGSGDHVGVLLEDGSTAVELLWATMRLGAVHVPLRPDWGANALRERAKAADVTTLVCDEATEATAVEAEVAPTVTMGTAEADAVSELTASDPDSVVASTWARSEPVAIPFTAGGAGDPRPVVLEMGNLLTSATDAAFRLGVSPADRWLACHPLHHVVGLTAALRATLFGSGIVIPNEATPGGLADLLETHDVTCLTAPPSTVSAMLEARGMLADSLRIVVVTGASVPPALLDRCRGYSIPALPSYSLTEAAGIVAAVAPGSADESGSVGYPLLRTDVDVVDDEGTPVGRGDVGELVVSGPSITPGYYDAETGGPVNGNGHGIATGDVGFRDEEGRVHVLSRRVDRILVGGEVVRAADVREVLCEHDDVEDAAVVGVSDPEWGERPAALIVRSKTGTDVDAEALREHCSARLAEFVVPEQFAFASALPRVSSGDLDRRAVRERILDGGPDAIDLTPQGERVSADMADIETDSDADDS